MDDIFNIGKKVLNFGKDSSSEDEESEHDLAGIGKSIGKKILKKKILGEDDTESSDDNGASKDLGNNPLTNIPFLGEIFQIFDVNGDGKVDAKDISCMLKKVGLGFVPQSVISQVMSQLDINGNGTFDLNDFMSIVNLINTASTMKNLLK